MKSTCSPLGTSKEALQAPMRVEVRLPEAPGNPEEASFPHGVSVTRRGRRRRSSSFARPGRRLRRTSGSAGRGQRGERRRRPASRSLLEKPQWVSVRKRGQWRGGAAPAPAPAPCLPSSLARTRRRLLCCRRASSASAHAAAVERVRLTVWTTRRTRVPSRAGRGCESLRTWRGTWSKPILLLKCV